MMKKQILSVIVALCMLVSVIPMMSITFVAKEAVAEVVTTGAGNEEEAVTEEKVDSAAVDSVSVEDEVTETAKEVIKTANTVKSIQAPVYAAPALLSPASAAGITYIDIDADGSEKTCTTATVINSENISSYTTLTAGWYAVEGTVSVSSTVTVSGDVKLILKDGCKFTVTGTGNSAGIRVSGDGNAFTVYGQSGQTGELNASGGSGDAGGAGIGGNNYEAGTNIIINGGTVISNGGSWAAGIGGGAGGFGNDDNVGVGHNITINGGTVTANAGSGAAGIGGGSCSDGHDITINGGTVVANGSYYGAGIGGGVDGRGYAITVNGGNVIAISNEQDYIADCDAAGIGNGKYMWFPKSAASGITVNADSTVKVGSNDSFTTVIKHTGATDIASSLKDKRYVKIIASYTMKIGASYSDAGFYGASHDDSPKTGVIAFSVQIKNISDCDDITGFGMYMYASDGTDITTYGVSSASKTQIKALKDSGGWMYGFADDISQTNFGKTVYCVPYIIVGSDDNAQILTQSGFCITGEVDGNTQYYLGKTSPVPVAVEEE